MRLPTLLRRRGAPTAIGGRVRLDRRTKNLTKRLRSGEIAVIHHSDLDRVSAEALVEAGVAAVINAVPSVSGRYPNLGPGILMDAGIPLIDDAGDQIFATVHEGELVTVDGGRVLSYHGTVVAEGTLYTTEILEEQLQYAREGLSDQIEAFAVNTMTYLREEKELLLEGVGVPDVAAEIEGRHVLIVVRGYDYRSDLDALRPYISEYRPLLMGVDGGADALIEAGYKPDMIIGDMDSCSDQTRCAAGPSWWCTPTTTAARRGWSGSVSWGCRPWCSRPWAQAKMPRCCWPTPRAPSCWWRWAGTSLWWSSWTRGGPAWPRLC